MESDQIDNSIVINGYICRIMIFNLFNLLYFIYVKIVID
jgi:hypothetical protein